MESAYTARPVVTQAPRGGGAPRAPCADSCQQQEALSGPGPPPWGGGAVKACSLEPMAHGGAGDSGQAAARPLGLSFHP